LTAKPHTWDAGTAITLICAKWQGMGSEGVPVENEIQSTTLAFTKGL